jgi:uncharacterized protein (UPF0335 family)
MAILPFKEDTDFAKHNQHAELTAQQDLTQVVQRLEALALERADLGREMSDELVVAKAKGFNVKAIKRLVAERKRDADELREEKDVVQLYKDMLLS